MSKVIIEKIKVTKNDQIVSKRKKVYISDNDLKLLIKSVKFVRDFADMEDLLKLQKRFRLELERRLGKRDTFFEGDYINPLIIKK